MSSETTQKQRVFKILFETLEERALPKLFERNEVGYNPKKDLELQEDIKLLREAANIVDGVIFFGGYQSLLKYATKGMELEQPDLFSREIVKKD